MEEEIEEKAKKLAEKLEKEKEQANVGNESTGLANTNT